MYKHVTWQHLNQYMTSKSRGHCDNIKVFNQGKSNQIRENSGKKQGIWLLKMCGHPVEDYQRLCECKNNSSITSNYRVITLPKFCNNMFVRTVSLKLLMGIKWYLAHWERAMRRRALCKNQNPFTSYYVLLPFLIFPVIDFFWNYMRQLNEN